MGYDMRIVGEIDLDEKALARIDELDKAIAELGFDWQSDSQDEDKRNRYLELADELSTLRDPGYFRLNIWGMGQYREVMTELAMLDWTATSPTQAGLEWPRWDDEDEDAEEKYDAAAAPLLAYHHPDEPMIIPGYKLCSNDGWVVTPEELHGALENLRHNVKVGKPLSDDATTVVGEAYWKQWVAYLERAEQNGGFAVY